MIVLNFSHPLTDAQYCQIEAQAGQTITSLRHVQTQFDDQQPFAPQLAALMEQIDLTPAQWQSAPLLVIPPALNFIAVALLAELHGRMGYFPPVVRMRPVADSTPRRYEVAEILNLQALREQARQQR